MSDLTNNVMKLDANETAFFTRQLEYVKSKSYDTKYQNLKATQMIPVSFETPAGSDLIVWQGFSQAGIAKIVADYANDFPRVDVYATENQAKVYSLGSSYGYSIKEIRRAQKGGVPLDVRRANAARRAIDEKIDRLAWYGDTDYNIPGFLSYPGITEYTVPATGTGSSKLWSTKTPDQIITDLSGILNAISLPTKGREEGNMILIPRASWNIIRNTRMTDGDTNTILSFFLNNNPGVEIAPLDELDGFTAGSPAVNRFMAYVKDPNNLELDIPQAFEMLEADKKGMEYEVPCHAEFGCVKVYFPQSVAFGDGI